MLRPALVLSLTLALSVGCASSQTLAPKGAKVLTDADLALGSSRKANRDSGGFIESVRVRGVVDGGGSIYARLMITNLATNDQLARMVVSIAPAGKPAAKVNIRRKRGKWSTKGGSLNATFSDIGGVRGSLAGDVRKVTWTSANSAVAIDLTLTSTVAPLNPPGGSADFGNGKYFKTTLIAPHARFEVKVTTAATADGQEATVATYKGWAFVEKRTGNVAPYIMAKRFVDVRDVDKDGMFAMSAFQRTTTFGGKTQGWMVCVRDGKIAVMSPHVTIRTEAPKPHAESGYNVPQLVHFQDRDDAAIKGVVKAGKLVRIYDDFKSLSKFERAIAERFAKPWTFRYRAAWALRSSKGKLAGGGFYSYNQLK